ncbi:MAG: aldo/keto reductase [Phycisphaerales bacterium]|nr:aldo/keto reductase [Phycisphaerales bacterium]
MEYRNLGSTGIRVSALGLGTVKLGRTAGVKYPEPFDLPSDAQAADLLAVARDLGINLIDTAPAYGTSELRLGKLLAGQRDDWVICTKAGEAFEAGASTYDFSADAVTTSIERSLLRLHTDYVDIALLHSDGADLRLFEHDEGLQALERLRERGLVRAIGVSTKTLEGSLRTIERCDLVMLPLNPIEHACAPAVEAARLANKGVLVKKALVSGHLSGRRSASDCLAYALEHRGVTSVIVGTINPEHLTANARAIDARK